jgi:hypothetical protein
MTEQPINDDEKKNGLFWTNELGFIIIPAGVTDPKAFVQELVGKKRATPVSMEFKFEMPRTDYGNYV